MRPNPTVRFGPFEVNFRTGELRKAGLRRKLPGIPMQILEMLLARPGDIVTRDALRSRLWPAGTHVDFENGLNTAMNKLRAALDDTAAEPRYIETLRQRGYRFIAAVEGVAAPVPRIVVLPFENLSRDAADEYFADGLTEDLIAHIGRAHAGRLIVIARTSAMRYKNSAMTIAAIARELDVDFLLEGAVRRDRTDARITARLIRASDEAQIWAESYDLTLDRVLAVQAQAARTIGEQLSLQLFPPAAQPAVLPEAYEHYLRGRFFWNKRTEAGLIKAAECYERAIECDGRFAMPYAGLADIYNVAGLYSAVGATPFEPAQAAAKAREAARRAFELDASLSEVHTALAFTKFLYDWDWSGAEAGFRKALAINPNDAAARGWFALFLAARARFDEALVEIDSALRIDPLSLAANAHKGWILYFARRFDDAAAQLRETCDMDPAFPLARYCLGLVHARQGNFPAAFEQFNKAFETLGSPDVRAALRGEPAGAAISPYLRAVIDIAQHRNEAALDALERAFAERSPWLVNLGVEPALDPLRGESRFQKLLRALGTR